MPQIFVAYGLLAAQGGRFVISFPDAPRVSGWGMSRDAAIENGAQKLRRHVAREAAAGRTFKPRQVHEFGWDDAVKLELSLGMELVAVPL